MCILLEAYWKSGRIDVWFASVHPAVGMGNDSERLGRYDLAKSVPNLIYLNSPVAILFFTCHLMNLMGADKIPTSP